MSAYDPKENLASDHCYYLEAASLLDHIRGSDRVLFYGRFGDLSPPPGQGGTNMKPDSNSMLKFAFILGAVVDGAIAVSWFLIASGVSIPNILNGYIGTGPDYQLAMYISATFMTGWTALLAWGALNPIERRGLLLITSGFLFLSVIVEFVFLTNILGGVWFMFGVTKRLLLSVLFTAIYFYSSKTEKS
jgi:hypothetical protein